MTRFCLFLKLPFLKPIDCVLSACGHDQLRSLRPESPASPEYIHAPLQRTNREPLRPGPSARANAPWLAAHIHAAASVIYDQTAHQEKSSPRSKTSAPQHPSHNLYFRSPESPYTQSRIPCISLPEVPDIHTINGGHDGQWIASQGMCNLVSNAHFAKKSDDRRATWRTRPTEICVQRI